MSSDGDARILVVDDVPENVRLLEAVLAPRGYEVVSATDGHAALEPETVSPRITSGAATTNTPRTRRREAVP
jgi:PleD family two-component response regulator